MKYYVFTNIRLDYNFITGMYLILDLKSNIYIYNFAFALHYNLNKWHNFQLKIQ